jgi:huntingtin
MASITVDDTMNAINRACKAKGGVYKEYSCKAVSWDDVKRGNVGGQLSCWGANITDTYLTARDGRRLFTVRSDNWNEKLGVIASSDLALVQGNQVPQEEQKPKQVGGNNFFTNLITQRNNTIDASKPQAKLKPITLKTFLENAKEYGSYAGLKTENLSDEILDKTCSIRFQTTFLPVASGDKATLEFATEAYNYNTSDDSDPRNLILLCTTQGIALQQDGKGKKKLFHHAVDAHNKIHRYWLEAEKTAHKVGGEQKESKAEREDAIARGKATSSVIGTKAMGQRFNVLMTIQIPLAQKKKPQARLLSAGLSPLPPPGICCQSIALQTAAIMDNMNALNNIESLSTELSMHATLFKKKVPKKKGWFGSSRKKRTGTANAARVSRGKEVDVWGGLSQVEPKRNTEEHITITIVSYFTIAGGVPSEDDVVAAIDDIEKLYASCAKKGKLAEPTFNFMKDELTVNDAQAIAEKISTQPAFVPSSVGVTDHSEFPA